MYRALPEDFGDGERGVHLGDRDKPRGPHEMVVVHEPSRLRQ